MDRDEDIVLYSSVLPLYFPRSSEEQSKVSELLPADTGNETGETVIEERKIRINATPIAPKGDGAPAAQAEPSTLNQAREEMPDESLSGKNLFFCLSFPPNLHQKLVASFQQCMAIQISRKSKTVKRIQRVRTNVSTGRCCAVHARRTSQISFDCNTSIRVAAIKDAILSSGSA